MMRFQKEGADETGRLQCLFHLLITHYLTPLFYHHTIKDGGQLMGRLQLCFIIDEEQQAVQEKDPSSEQRGLCSSAFTSASLHHRNSQSLWLQLT